MKLKTSPAVRLGIFRNDRTRSNAFRPTFLVEGKKGNNPRGPRWWNARASSLVVTLLSFVALLVGSAHSGVVHADPLPVVDESGTLSSSETWSAGNVYLIQSQVTVPDGYTLTIDAGAIIKYEPGYGYNYITVDSGATLDVNGTSTSSVIFTSYYDDSAGGDSNGDGDATSPAPGDYSTAIDSENGGTVDVSYATIEYASTAVNESCVSGSSATFTDNAFDSPVSINNCSQGQAVLQSNQFTVPASLGHALNLGYDQLTDSDIPMSGTSENTFSGSDTAKDVALSYTSSVPTSSTWTFDPSTGAVLFFDDSGGSDALDVNGTLDLQAGSVVKNSNYSTPDIAVESGGILNASGTSDSHVTFTSINDDSVGSTVYGSSGSPAARDYSSAIALNGGTANVSYADFAYADHTITEVNSSGGPLTVTDSSFTNSDVGIQDDYANMTLERNSFALDSTGGSYGSYAIEATGDPDLTGIVLSGSGENTFSGSGKNVEVSANGTVPSDETWTLDSSSGAVLDNEYTTSVDGTLTLDSNTVMLDEADGYGSNLEVTGTVNLDSGVVIKGKGAYSTGEGIQVDSGGTLNATGTSTSPITFTSINDDSAGGTAPGSSGSPTVADYADAIVLNGGTTNVSYADFEYAYRDIGEASSSGGPLTVTDSSFSDSGGGIQDDYANMTLERNSFALDSTGGSYANYAIEATGDPDLTGIVLSGSDENTFSGSGKNVVVSANGTVPSGETWADDSSSGTVLDNEYTTTVDGTLTLDANTVLLNQTSGPGVEVGDSGTVNLGSGVVVKGNGSYSTSDGIEVDSGGTLNVNGTSDSHVTFTSINDDSVGGTAPYSSGSPAVDDYAGAIALNGGTVSISYADFEYADQAVTDENNLSGGSQVTMNDGSFANNKTAVLLTVDEQANFEDVTVSNATTGLDVRGTAQVTFRGSFSNISDKAIKSCNWDSDSGNGCVVDAAYIDWGSSDGPFDEDPSDDMVCGTVTVAPWVHSGTDYNNTNLFQVPNCDGSTTPDTALTDAADSYSTSLTDYYTSCNGGLEAACTAYNDEIACLEDAVNLAATATGDPITLPNDDSHQWAVDASTTTSDILSSGASVVQSNAVESVAGHELSFFSKVFSIVTFIQDAVNAYNQCIQ